MREVQKENGMEGQDYDMKEKERRDQRGEMM
jgi:hypothetical protein